MTDQDQIQALKAENAQLRTLLTQALARISEMKAWVLKSSTVKTSKNSSKPLSTDVGRKKQSLRPKSDKPVGVQFGHKGRILKMSDTPDVTEKIYPDFYNNCGLSPHEGRKRLGALIHEPVSMNWWTIEFLSCSPIPRTPQRII